MGIPAFLLGLQLMLPSVLATWPGGPPRRPKLPAGADTCDAFVYYAFGIQELTRAPKRAEEAFYWASRIDPTWAQPLDAERVATLIDKDYLLKRYFEDTPRSHSSRDILRLDSLDYRAFMLNPFLLRNLDQRLLYYYLRMQSDPNISDGDLNAEINQSLAAANPELFAWNAEGHGYYRTALAGYAEALKATDEKWGLYAERGRLFVMLGQFDSAKASFSAALAELRAKDRKKLVFVYDSKALYEYGIALLDEQQDDTAAARQGYARALEEDMSYYPAYLRLAALDVAAGDTTNALGQLGLAMQANGNAPVVLLAYGKLLVAAGHAADAVAPLRKLIGIDPYFAATYFSLGQALEATGKKSDAVQAYDQFLSHARRQDPNRPVAMNRLAALGAPAGSGGSQ